MEDCPDQITSLYAYATALNVGGSIVGDWSNFNLTYQRMFCVPSLSEEEWTDATNDKTGERLLKLIKTRKCPAYTLSSIGIAGRCVPDFGILSGKTNETVMEDDSGNYIENDEGTIKADNVMDAIKAIVEILNLQEFGEKIFSDLIKSKWMLLAGLGIGKNHNSAP